MGLPKLVCLKTTAGLQISPTSLIPPNLALRPHTEEPGSLYQQLGDWGKQIFSFWQFCFISFSRGGEGTGWISVDLLGQLAPEGTWHTPQKQHRLKQSSRDGPRKQRDRPPRSGCQRLFRWADHFTDSPPAMSYQANNNCITKYFSSTATELQVSACKGCGLVHSHREARGSPAVPCSVTARVGSMFSSMQTVLRCPQSLSLVFCKGELGAKEQNRVIALSAQRLECYSEKLQGASVTPQIKEHLIFLQHCKHH